jgi:hypothetical protein
VASAKDDRERIEREDRRKRSKPHHLSGEFLYPIIIIMILFFHWCHGAYVRNYRNNYNLVMAIPIGQKRILQVVPHLPYGF